MKCDNLKITTITIDLEKMLGIQYYITVFNCYIFSPFYFDIGFQLLNSLEQLLSLCHLFHFIIHQMFSVSENICCTAGRSV